MGWKIFWNPTKNFSQEWSGPGIIGLHSSLDIFVLRSGLERLGIHPSSDPYFPIERLSKYSNYGSFDLSRKYGF